MEARKRIILFSEESHVSEDTDSTQRGSCHVSQFSQSSKRRTLFLINTNVVNPLTQPASVHCWLFKYLTNTSLFLWPYSSALSYLNIIIRILIMLELPWADTVVKQMRSIISEPNYSCLKFTVATEHRTNISGWTGVVFPVLWFRVWWYHLTYICTVHLNFKHVP